MRLEVFIVGSHGEPSERNEALTTVFGLSVCDVLLYLVDDLSKTALLLVVARDEAVHRWDQVNAFLFDKGRLRLAEHSLNLVDDPFSLLLTILIFAIDYLLTRAILRNKFAQNGESRVLVVLVAILTEGLLNLLVDHHRLRLFNLTLTFVLYRFDTLP